MIWLLKPRKIFLVKPELHSFYVNTREQGETLHPGVFKMLRLVVTLCEYLSSGLRHLCSIIPTQDFGHFTKAPWRCARSWSSAGSETLMRVGIVFVVINCWAPSWPEPMPCIGTHPHTPHSLFMFPASCTSGFWCVLLFQNLSLVFFFTHCISQSTYRNILNTQ